MADRVVVLMSTYNGEKFIREQLNSIFHQEEVEISLVVRDDGSTDATVEILREYEKKYENMQVIVNGKNLKPCLSFLSLICSIDNCAFYALADQDDIWDRDKLNTAIQYIRKESQDIPILYHSNLRVVDENDVFYRNAHIEPQIAKNKYECLVGLSATGCTIVYNRALAQLVHGRIPDKYSMHDTFLYNMASLCGKVIYDFQPHIDYRQHANNSVGTYLDKKSINVYFKQLARLFNRKLQPRYDNAKEIMRLYGEMLKKDFPECYKKIEKIVQYKYGIKEKLILLSDKDLRPTKSIIYLIRYYILVGLGLL